MKIMTTRPPEILHAFLKKEAQKEGYTLNSLVIQILWDWVKKKETEASDQVV